MTLQFCYSTVVRLQVLACSITDSRYLPRSTLLCFHRLETLLYRQTLLSPSWRCTRYLLTHRSEQALPACTLKRRAWAIVYIYIYTWVESSPISKRRNHQTLLRPQVLELVVEVDVGDGNDTRTIVVDVVGRVRPPVETSLPWERR